MEDLNMQAERRNRKRLRFLPVRFSPKRILYATALRKQYRKYYPERLGR